jgi:hypothetical protein
MGGVAEGVPAIESDEDVSSELIGVHSSLSVIIS